MMHYRLFRNTYSTRDGGIGIAMPILKLHSILSFFKCLSDVVIASFEFELVENSSIVVK